MPFEQLHYGFELKGVEENGQFEGYASTFGNTDLQGDIVEPGAFTSSLKEHKGVVPILWQHDYRSVVGFGIEAVQDFKGLAVRGELTLSHPDGQKAYATMQHAQKVGHKMGLSIGFTLSKKNSWVMDGTVRRLKNIDLKEYSVATFPANPQAVTTRVKSLEEITEREFEDAIRDVLHLSQRQAKVLIAEGFRALKAQRDVGDDSDAVIEAETFLANLKAMEEKAAVEAMFRKMDIAAQ